MPARESLMISCRKLEQDGIAGGQYGVAGSRHQRRRLPPAQPAAMDLKNSAPQHPGKIVSSECVQPPANAADRHSP